MSECCSTTTVLPWHPALEFRAIARFFLLSALMYYLALGSNDHVVFWSLIAVCFQIALSLNYWLVRKLLADMAHLHVEKIKLSLSLNGGAIRICVQFQNVVFWVVWWEKPGVKGGLDVPLQKVYKRIPYCQMKLFEMFFAEEYALHQRAPIERWEERTRLLLTAAKEAKVTVSIPIFSKVRDLSKSPVQVEINELRQHLPVATDDTPEEQKILYPNGYPNFIKPVFEMWCRFAFVLKPLIHYGSSFTTVTINSVEVHGLPNFAGMPSEKEEEGLGSLFTVDGIRKAIKETREVISNTARVYRHEEDERFLTVLIEQVEASLSGTLMTSSLTRIKVYKGKQYVIHEEEAFSLVDIGSLRSFVDIKKLLQDVKKFNENATTEKVRNKVVTSVALAEEKVAINTGLLIVSKTLIQPPYKLNSDYVALVVEKLKKNLMNSESLEGSEQNIAAKAKQIIQPLMDLWWEDIGIGQWAGEIIGVVAARLVKGASGIDKPVSWEEELLFTW